jgi:carboxypeptidase Taq
MENRKYEDYKSLMHKIKDLEYATGVLHWDMETYMPSKGVRFRSQQMATLQALAHEIFTAESTGVLLKDLAANQQLDEIEKANIHLSLEDYEKATKLPNDFVKESSLIRTDAFQAWLKAKEANDIVFSDLPSPKWSKIKNRRLHFLGRMAMFTMHYSISTKKALK